MADVATTADWIAAWGQVGGAVGTTAAIGVALWLAYRESRWRRADQTERDAERADRDAAQARLVTVEPTYPQSGYEPDSSVVVRVLNGSALPIFEVKIVDLRNDEAPDHTWHIDDSVHDMFKIEARVLPAGEVFALPVCYADPAGHAVFVPGKDHVTVEFTDANGLRWRRRDNEAPERVIG